jgi:ribonuclease H2 subunit C
MKKARSLSPPRSKPREANNLATGTQHVHFRGRHLHGTTLPLPENYTGAVLRVTEKLVPQDWRGEAEDEVEEAMVEVKIAERIGEFDEIVVWEHGGRVDEERDVYVRGVREWIRWAECMHGGGEEDTQGEKIVEEKVN